MTWFVLSGCTKKDAFITWARPDMLGSKAKAAIDDYVKQFFAQKAVGEYIEAYQQTLNAFLHPEEKEKPEEESKTLEEKRSEALAMLVEYVLSQASNIENADDPKAILDYANKIGLFDTKEEVEMAPRRYLPVVCSDCAYRKFVEENCEEVPDGTELDEGV